jgi:Fe-S-cluster containining protein
MPTATLPVINVVNLETATFECTFGRGCAGHCCKNGRPSVGPEEVSTITEVLPRALPLLRAEARALIEVEGFLSRRRKLDMPMVRVAAGWCVFFNNGCVLHQLGVEDGESYRYKPRQCALFPLERDTKDGAWYVRQWGVRAEEWDLFCLNPQQSPVPASESLAAEIALAERMEGGNQGYSNSPG